PNVVLVFADDLGIGDVGYNRLFAVGGAVHTPVLDQIAAQGTKLTRFYTNALCTPSRASLLTGRFASRTNMKNPDGEARSNKESRVLERSQLLPEVLKDMGYQTHMVGKWHLGQHERKFTPLGRGFDTYCGNLGGAADNFHHNCEILWNVNRMVFVVFSCTLWFNVQATYSEFYLANVYGQHSVEVIEAHDPGDGPLFLYTAFTAGHDPLQ
ncbi:unnamed protein product, partial [Sphacelaria rigidula]